ncbi:hypothetical protein LMG33818_000900 [Halomonadaceae bacterium LMG 33818]|uniref:hypothetical protein n=1 Tax=Cernens ardua TaxID=3402176 RepID=UPI003EDBC9D3
MEKIYKSTHCGNDIYLGNVVDDETGDITDEIYLYLPPNKEDDLQLLWQVRFPMPLTDFEKIDGQLESLGMERITVSPSRA